MSAGDYYNPNNRYGANASPQPVGEPYAHYDRGRSPAPAYTPTPQQHLGANDRNDRTGQSGHASGTSPFDSVFDDHVYPANTPSSSQHQLNDIPLQNQSRAGAPKDHADMQDHVYDAPQRKRARKAGVRFGELGMFGANNAKRIPWVVYLFTVVQVVVFIVEIVKNATATGSPIMIQPSFNPMIGPSPYILINMGARFVPCMHNVQQIQTSPVRIKWPCPNTTTLDGNSLSNNCTLSELCGFGGVPEFYAGPNGMDSKPEPNQWFRFITPIFMHAGIIHIGFNLLLQLTMGREMEKSIGSIRFFLVYMSAGIFGFVLGSNFAAAGIPSTGASGSLFGVIALTLLDLLYSWKDRRSPVKDLMFILLDVIISFVLGLLPGLDNFSHIGGFLMGLALGICVLHSPNALRRRIGDDAPYSQVNNGYLTHGAPPSFLKNPVGFFKGRKPLWWAWWLVRAGALVLVTIVFILLLNNFYIYRNTCSWCKYLSCLPVNNWCEIGNLTLSDTPKRSFIPSALGGLEESVKLW